MIAKEPGSTEPGFNYEKEILFQIDFHTHEQYDNSTMRT